LEYRLGGILRLLEKEHSISMAQLHEDLKKSTLQEKIEADIERGLQCGITITPAVFINGVRYVGVLEYNALAKAIEQVLSKQRFNRWQLMRLTTAPLLPKPRPERNTTGQLATV